MVATTRRSNRARQRARERAAVDALFANAFNHAPAAVPTAPADDAPAPAQQEPPAIAQADPPNAAHLAPAAPALAQQQLPAAPYINPVAINVNPAVANGAFNMGEIIAAIDPPPLPQNEPNPHADDASTAAPAPHIPNPQEVRGARPRTLREQYTAPRCESHPEEIHSNRGARRQCCYGFDDRGNQPTRWRGRRCIFESQFGTEEPRGAYVVFSGVATAP